MVASIPCLNILSARKRPQRSVRSEYLDVRNKAATACAAGHVAAGASEQKRQAWSYESVSASKFKASQRGPQRLSLARVQTPKAFSPACRGFVAAIVPVHRQISRKLTTRGLSMHNVS